MDFFVGHAYVFWLMLFVIFCALELASLGLTSIWFAVGSLAACIASLFDVGWVAQSVVFIASTVIVLIFLRPIALKYVNNKAEKTNVESMIGKTGKVVSDINNEEARGMILVDGVEWTARSADGSAVPKDSMVEIIAIEGVKAMVKRVE